MVHVAHVELVAPVKDHSKSVQSQGRRDLVVEYPCAQVEPLEVLTGLRVVTLLFGELAHLEVYMSLFQEVALLDPSLRFNDKV